MPSRPASAEQVRAKLGAGREDDSSALPLLKRLSRISNKTQSDISKFVAILEHDEGYELRKVPLTEPRERQRSD